MNIYLKVWKKIANVGPGIDEKKRWQIINITTCLLIFMTWVLRIVPASYQSVIYIVWFCLLLFLAFILNRGKYFDIKFSPLILIYFIYSFLFLLGAIVSEREGAIIVGIVYIVVFPLITISAFDSKERTLLLNSFFHAIIFNFLLLLVLSILFLNASNYNQYGGIIGNANSFSIIALACFIAAIFQNHNNGNIKYRYLIIMGASLGAIFVAQSRSVMICVFIDLIICAFFAIKRKVININYKKTICIFITIIITIMLVLYFNQIMAQLVGHIFSIDAGAIGNTFKVRIAHGFDGNGTFTTGRSEIWQAYLNDLSIFPHTDQEMPYIGGEMIDHTAHNTYLHLGYCFGILCGIAYLLNNICFGIKGAILLVKNSDNLKLLIGFIIILNYGIISLVETIYDPITNILCFTYIMACSMIVPKKNN